MKGRGITKNERAEINRISALLDSEEMPIPKEVTAFFRKVQRAPGSGTVIYGDYITSRHGRLLLRKFAIGTNSTHRKAKLAEVMRCYADGKPVFCNFSVSWGFMRGLRIETYFDSDTITPWKSDETFRYDGRLPGIHKMQGYVINEKSAVSRYGKYSKWETYRDWGENNYNSLNMFEYLSLYKRYPEIEFLVEGGYYELVKHVNSLRAGKTYTEIFGIEKEWDNFIHGRDAYRNLRTLRAHPWIEDGDFHNLIRTEDVLKQQCRYKEIKAKEWKKIASALGDEKFFRYLMAITSPVTCEAYGVRGYNAMDIYLDFMSAQMKLGAPIERSQFLPENLMEAHDAALKEGDALQKRQRNDAFAKSYEEAAKFLWQSDGFIIRPVKTEDELIHESKVLLHCVRTYAQRVADGSCQIFFIRPENSPDTPFVTLELKGKQVVQARAAKNAAPPEDVKRFISAWAENYKLNYAS